MMNDNSFHVIKDPVYGTMQFTTLENNWIKPFINSPMVQRLRHIKQLGMGDFIFPGAVHTRFNHSLGCCYMASQIAHKIGLSDEERQLVMIACLLHDIGHGPFSHTFEDLFHQKALRHEAWTPFFLAEYRHDAFFTDYQRSNPDHPLHPNTLTQIEQMIMHQTTPKRLLADIVSSQLDADRLDYLLRDSHFCGVTYGQFDYRWMLNSMAAVSLNQEARLGITYKGIGVVEHYLAARRLMVRNIYQYQKKLALEFMLVQFLVNLSNDLEDYAPFAELKPTRLGQFLIEVNRFNHAINAATNLAEHANRFLQANFNNYKELSDYDVFSAIKWLANCTDHHPAAQLAKRLQYRHMPKIISLNHVDIHLIEKRIADFRDTHREIKEWQFSLIQSPHRSYKMEEDRILVVDENERVQPIDEMSFMIKAISEKSEHTAFLYIDKAVMDNPAIVAMMTELSKPIQLPA